MALARFMLVVTTLVALATSAFGDTVVERRPACVDQMHLAEVKRLSASGRKAEAMTLFAAGVRRRACRFLEIGEVVAVLAVDRLVRLLSFVSGDRMWTDREAIARCDTVPDWLPLPKYKSISRQRPHHTTAWTCRVRATK